MVWGAITVPVLPRPALQLIAVAPFSPPHAVSN